MFYKCRLDLRQTGMIFGENAMKVTNLKGLQDGGSRLGQSVSILMNWRPSFEKRSQQPFGPKRATSGVVAHSWPTAAPKQSYRRLQRAQSYHPECSQLKIPSDPWHRNP